MGFFMSPVKLIEVITNSASMNQKIQKPQSKWYFSKEGEKAYLNAKTTGQKVIYFYNYLSTVSEYTSSANNRFLQGIAYVLATAVDGCSKPYGSWPAILNREENPLVDYAVEHLSPDITDIFDIAQKHDMSTTEVEDYLTQSCIAGALSAVRGAKDKDVFMPYTADAYLNLTKYEDDPELFLIERCIIFTLSNGDYDMENGVGPYNFTAEEAE